MSTVANALAWLDGGLGRLGLPASVPFLLDLMATTELTEPAAAATSWASPARKSRAAPRPNRPPA